MKLILRTIPTLLVAAAGLANAGIVQAKTLCPVGGGFEGLCNIKIGENGGGIVGTIVIVLLIIAIVVSLFFIIFGGVRYVTAAGDQGKTQQARSTIIAAIVGLVIALSAFLIVNVVSYVFTGGGLERLNNLNLKL